MIKISKWLLVFMLGAFLVHCASHNANPLFGKVSKVPAAGTIPERIVLDQNWNPTLREQFWFTSQGSQLLPYAWFTWLEQANNQQPFRSVENMEALRYLPEKSSAVNPAGLPIGFAMDIDRTTNDAWVGITCAACHTAQIDYGEHKILIEGGPTMGNFVAFLDQLVAALNATTSDSEKFSRFAQHVLGKDHNKEFASKLKKAVIAATQELEERITINSLPPNYPNNFTSYGRMDAFGNILNMMAAVGLNDPSNTNPPNAPVSFPFLWGTPQSNVVQWNGVADNRATLGPLLRNAGESASAFAGIKIRPSPWWKKWIFQQPATYTSAAKLIGLGHIERTLHSLRSPQWPEDILPAIDQQLAQQGHAIYQLQCADCHQLMTRTEQADLYDAKLISVATVGTEPLMTYNASYDMVRTNFLSGTKSGIFAGKRFQEIEPGINIALNGALGILVADPVSAYKSILLTNQTALQQVNEKDPDDAVEKMIEDYIEIADPIKDDPPQEFQRLSYQQQLAATKKFDNLFYKARPLTGIWATAPYLHNGSVASLAELLTTPAERLTEFYIGNRQFDPVKVGFVTSEGPEIFHVTKARANNTGTNELQPGNANVGHTFGTHLTPAEKISLLEFLKTL